MEHPPQLTRSLMHPLYKTEWLLTSDMQITLSLSFFLHFLPFVSTCLPIEYSVSILICTMELGVGIGIFHEFLLKNLVGAGTYCGEEILHLNLRCREDIEKYAYEVEYL